MSKITDLASKASDSRDALLASERAGHSSGRVMAFDSFDYHTPTPDQITAIEVFRQKAKDFREALDCLRPSREKSLALTNLEQALMWSNKAAVAV